MFSRSAVLFASSGLRRPTQTMKAFSTMKMGAPVRSITAQKNPASFSVSAKRASPSLFSQEGSRKQHKIIPASSDFGSVVTTLRSYSSNTPPRAPRSIFRPVVQKPQVIDSEAELTTLTPAIRSHLRKVYGTLATTSLLGGASCTLSIMSGIGLSPGLSLLGGLGLVLGVSFTPQQYSLARLGMLYGFAVLEGLALAPLVGSTAIVSPGAIGAALLGTGAVFTGFTGVALMAKSRSMLTLGGPLFGSLLGILGLQLAGYFFPSMAGISHAVSMYGGLALFSAYIAYDTQRMIENARYGMTDYIGDAMAMFLNLANVFIRLLAIFRRED